MIDEWLIAVAEGIERIAHYVLELPTGIDAEAKPENTSPDDATAHLGGLIWQELEKIRPLIAELVQQEKEKRWQEKERTRA